MSKVRADSYTNRAGDGAPTFTYGSVVTGIQTATTFKGAGSELTGTANNLTVATAQGLSGTPSITINALTASSGSVSGNFSVGGTLTYEDVTNIDSVGLITARSGINVLAGISTFKGADFDGGTIIKEKCNINAGKLSDNINIDLENGMVH